MSSYNENLHANVLASLQTQELELKKVKAKKNATMFTLYYAEGATLKASEELENTVTVLENKGAVKTQAVANSNISNNLLDSANQAGSYVKQSVTNSAVGAANVQLAANSIVRLASDLGSIYGILNAADNKSDMYVLAEEARRLINKTAYDAELASQTAMEASILTSEVTASTVQDKAKSNNDLMNSVLKIVSDEFTATSQLAIADNATLAAASAVEKLSEGDYLDITVDDKSTKSAYKATNEGLNLDLTVTGKSSTGFTIGFERIKMPFKHLQEAGQAAANPPNPYYPVKKYYFIIVKDKNKSTFSISNAENLLISDNAIAATSAATITPSNSGGTTPPSADAPPVSQPLPANPTKQIIPLQIPVTPINPVVTATETTTNQTSTVTPTPGKKKPSYISQAINFQEMMIDDKLFTIQDSDGEYIKLGTKYVVFVFALYADDYKKKINCFDEFLSAPSPSFKLTTKLVAVDGSTITINMPSAVTAVAAGAPPSTTQATTAPSAPYDYLLNFKVAENPDNARRVEYRCIFLPPNDPWAGILLNKESTLALNQEVESLEAIAEDYDPQIAEAQASVIAIQNYLTILNSKKDSLSPKTTQPSTATGSAEPTAETSAIPNPDLVQLNAVIAQISAQTTKLGDSQKTLSDLIVQRDAEIDKIKNGSGGGKIEFLFNLKIAEQVLAGNYIVADNAVPVTPAPPSTTAPPSKKAKSTANDASAIADPAIATPASPVSDKSANPLIQWDVKVGADVTDNFGSPLIPGKTYIPVILSYCTAEEKNLAMFTNNWSGYNSSTPFPYKTTVTPVPVTIPSTPTSPASTND